jgi:hypothetical protein
MTFSCRRFSMPYAVTDNPGTFLTSLLADCSERVPARPGEACHTREESNIIERLSGFPKTVLAFACKGQVTTRDYETVMIPTVEDSLKQQGNVRLYYQIDPGFSGIEPGAIWDDCTVGIGNLLRWERIAVVTDVKWIRYTFCAFSFVIPCQVKLFRANETAEAQSWIVQDMTS